MKMLVESQTYIYIVILLSSDAIIKVNGLSSSHRIVVHFALWSNPFHMEWSEAFLFCSTTLQCWDLIMSYIMRLNLRYFYAFLANNWKSSYLSLNGGKSCQVSVVSIDYRLVETMKLLLTQSWGVLMDTNHIRCFKEPHKTMRGCNTSQSHLYWIQQIIDSIISPMS